MREIERRVVLSVLDRKWREHLYEMDYLREGIGCARWRKRDPLVEYQREGYDMFNSMMDGIKEESVGTCSSLQFEIQENPIVEEVGSGAQLAFGGALPGVTTGGVPQQAAAPAAQAPAPAGRPVTLGPPAGGSGAGGPAGGLRPQAGRRWSGRRPAGWRPARWRAVPGPARGRRRGPRHGGGPRSGGDAQQRCPRGRAAMADMAEVNDTIPGDTGPQPVLPTGFEPRRPRNLQYSAPRPRAGVRHRAATAKPPTTLRNVAARPVPLRLRPQVLQVAAAGAAQSQWVATGCGPVSPGIVSFTSAISAIAGSPRGHRCCASPLTAARRRDVAAAVGRVPAPGPPATLLAASLLAACLTTAARPAAEGRRRGHRLRSRLPGRAERDGPGRPAPAPEPRARRPAAARLPW